VELEFGNTCLKLDFCGKDRGHGIWVMERWILDVHLIVCSIRLGLALIVGVLEYGTSATQEHIRYIPFLSNRGRYRTYCHPVEISGRAESPLSTIT
jgi:hypothetical protein